jgi:hypothetical protein
MSNTSADQSFQSWIPPVFIFEPVLDVCAIEISIRRSREVVSLVANGCLEFVIDKTLHEARAICRAWSTATAIETLLHLAAWDPAFSKPDDPVLSKGDTVSAHCHAVFYLNDRDSWLLLLSRHPPSRTNLWLSTALRTEATALNASIQAAEATWDDMPDPSPERFLDLVPKALLIETPRTLKSSSSLARLAAAIEGSGLPPARDGKYTGIPRLLLDGESFTLLTWFPHVGRPAYPEIRWAVQRRFPRALRKPRLDEPARPWFGPNWETKADIWSVTGSSIDVETFFDPFLEASLDLRDRVARVEKIREALRESGFEAIAWYQAYHFWNEDTWGIYFDAEALDDFALSLLQDLHIHGLHGSHAVAAMLALGTVYSHEMFHAKVEATLSWMELNAGQPRHLRYKHGVYDALRETPEWLEEALANWSAWEWFNLPTVHERFTRLCGNGDILAQVVESSLDLSPPGYREWRLGRQKSTWRTFSTQIASGSPTSRPPGRPLPLESIFGGESPYDFRPADIPLRFVGNGRIADRLLAHPASFHVPAKRELEKALAYFKHEVMPAEGKGGHQKWVGPDGRAFTVPSGKMVSEHVFRTFLHHVGITKFDYVSEVRPRL